MQRPARSLWSIVLTTGLALVLPLGVTEAAAAVPTPESEARVARLVGPRIAAHPMLSRHTVGLVTDAATGRVVWRYGADVGRMPASTTKVATAIAALTVLNPASRLATTVHRGEIPTRIVLRAGGDPELTSASLDRLAAATAAAVRARGRTSVSLRVDDAIFAPPTLATGWRASYWPDIATPIRGLKYDRRYVWDTTLDAATYFAARLERRGVGVTTLARERGAPTAGLLASVTGWTIEDITQRMLNASSNDGAEYLARLVARRLGYGTDWASVRTATRVALVRAGVGLTGFTAYDGSGLSRSNRITPAALVRMLRVVNASPALRAAFFASGALPTAGVDGTLSSRYRTAPTACARRLVQAKTGTLTGAVTLAGRTVGTDGRAKIFAFMVAGRDGTAATRDGIDRLATTVNGCW